MGTAWSAEDRDAARERARAVARLPGVEPDEAHIAGPDALQRNAEQRPWPH